MNLELLFEGKIYRGKGYWARVILKGGRGAGRKERVKEVLQRKLRLTINRGVEWDGRRCGALGWLVEVEAVRGVVSCLWDLFFTFFRVSVRLVFGFFLFLLLDLGS